MLTDKAVVGVNHDCRAVERVTEALDQARDDEYAGLLGDLDNRVKVATIQGDSSRHVLPFVSASVSGVFITPRGRHGRERCRRHATLHV